MFCLELFLEDLMYRQLWNRRLDTARNGRFPLFFWLSGCLVICHSLFLLSSDKFIFSLRVSVFVGSVAGPHVRFVTVSGIG